MLRAFVFSIALLTCSCRYFKKERKPEAVARVGDSYLFRQDITDLVPPEASPEDSIAITQAFIDRWARQKLLIKAAEINLGEEQTAEIDELVSQYKTDLITKAYLEAIVKKSVDTVVKAEELKDFYQSNKQNFRTPGKLIRLRYVQIAKDHPKLATVKSKFFDFRKADEKFWNDNAMNFRSYSLADSVWIDMGQVYSRLRFINPDNRDQYIAAGKSIQHHDSTYLYMVKIVGVIDQNQVSPYEYIKPSLKEVILNKRKLELLRNFEKEITNDAIKENEYEIYK